MLLAVLRALQETTSEWPFGPEDILGPYGALVGSLMINVYQYREGRTCESQQDSCEKDATAKDAVIMELKLEIERMKGQMELLRERSGRSPSPSPSSSSTSP